ncbi:MAG: sigma-54 dependent transcriptional regulator [bacterium]
MKRILIVEDQESTRLALHTSLCEQGFEVDSAVDGMEGLIFFKQKLHDLVLTDVRMPGLTGMELLQRLKNHNPSVIVIVMTAYGSINDAVEAIKKGAFDYIVKPFTMDEIDAKIRKSFKPQSAKRQKPDADVVLQSFEGKYSYDEKMKNVYDIASRAANNKSNVLIRGESGTGKELIARAIHYGSYLKDAPFVKVNCAALAEGILESELFGHEKGAFTGALQQRKGKFEIADGGTLFLDEIGDVTLSTQVQLLRLIQEKEFERVGGNQTFKVDVRIVSATNKNLEEEIKQGKFREDLFYRLNVIPIFIPPLRERKNDIKGLVEYFIRKVNEQNQTKVTGLDPAVIDSLLDYPWPGNIRELENLIERLVVLTSKEVLQMEDLPCEISNYKERSDAVYTQGFQNKTDVFEKNLIKEALDKCKGVQAETARFLGMDRSTLRYKMNKYGLK